MRFVKWLLAGLLAVFGIYKMGRKSAADEIRAETAEQARELEKQANKANAQGEAEEQRIRDEIRNKPVRRTDID